MSEHVMAIVRDRHFGDSTLKHVMGRLAWAARDDGSHIIVSIDTIADDCDLTENTIRRVLRKAERLGVLRLEESERGPWPRRYSLDVTLLVEAFPLTSVCNRRLARPWGAA
jgi:hypothetical protein